MKKTVTPAGDAGRGHLSRQEWTALGCAVALAVAVRVVWLGRFDLRSDEVVEIVKAQHLREVLTQGMLLDVHAPLFSVVTALWATLGFAGAEWKVRLLPVLLGVGAVPALYFVTRHIYGHRAAFITALLLAVSPFHVTLSRDLKDDVFLVFAGTLTMYFLMRAAKDDKTRHWAGYTLTAAVACYAQFFIGPLLFFVNIWFIIFARAHKGRFLRWAAANAVAVVLIVPMILFTLWRAHAVLGGSDWWVPRPTPATVGFYIKTLAYGYSDHEPYFKLATVIYVLLGATGVWIAWREDRRWTVFFLFWSVLPVTAMYLLSQQTQSVFLYRSMALYGLPLYVWAGLAISRTKPRAARACLVGGLFMMASTPLHELYAGRFPTYEFPHRPGHPLPLEFRKGAEFIRSRARPGDIVLHTAHTNIFPFYYYGLADLPQANVGADQEAIDHFQRTFPPVPMPKGLELVRMTALQPIVRDKERVWLVFTEAERMFLASNPMLVYRWMDEHYVETLHESFDGYEIFLFQKSEGGEVIRVVSRDKDDGVTSQLQYAGGMERSYTKIRADAGIIPAPPEARRGALTLRFLGPLKSDTNTIAFGITNRSQYDVPCTVMMVASDVMIDAASLYPEEMQPGAWRVNPQFNPQPPPQDYPLSAAVATVKGLEPRVIAGPVSLPAAEYDTFIYMIGRTDDAAALRARVEIEFGGAGIFPANHGAPTAAMKWEWLRGNAVSAGNALTDLRIMAHSGNTTERCYADIAYVAFLRKGPGAPTLDPSTPWPGDVIIPAGESPHWECEIPETAERVDVWVYERGENGLAYRIFSDRRP